MIDLKQHNFPYDSFIGGWYIPEHICDGMLDYYYQKSNDITPGVVGNLQDDNDPVKPDVKDSLDLFMNLMIIVVNVKLMLVIYYHVYKIMLIITNMQIKFVNTD